MQTTIMQEQGSHWRAARVVLGELQFSGWSGWIRETCGRYADAESDMLPK